MTVEVPCFYEHINHAETRYRLHVLLLNLANETLSLISSGLKFLKTSSGEHGVHNFRFGCQSFVAHVHYKGDETRVRHVIRFEREDRFYASFEELQDFDVYVGYHEGLIDWVSNTVIENTLKGKTWCTLKVPVPKPLAICQPLNDSFFEVAE